MGIKPEMIDYIRTMVRGDYERNDQIEAALDTEGWDNFSTLLGVVFYFAVNRRLAETSNSTDIIRLVAEMRASTPSNAPEVDVNAAEKLIRAALDPSIEAKVDPEMAGSIQGLTILYILGDPSVSDAELERILSDAAEVASRY